MESNKPIPREFMAAEGLPVGQPPLPPTNGFSINEMGDDPKKITISMD
jgi:hypothetical protein